MVAFRFRLVFLLQRFAHVAEGNCRCRRFGRKSLYQKSEAQAQCDVFLLAHIVVQWPGTQTGTQTEPAHAEVKSKDNSCAGPCMGHKSSL